MSERKPKAKKDEKKAVPSMTFSLRDVENEDARALIAFQAERGRHPSKQDALLALMRSHPLYLPACAAFGVEPVANAIQTT